MLVFVERLVKATWDAFSPIEYIVFGLYGFILTGRNSFNFDKTLGIVVIWNVLLRLRVDEAKHESEIGLS